MDPLPVVLRGGDSEVIKLESSSSKKFIMDTKEQNNKNNILSGLNDRQKEAVTAVNGPVLIIAGAGSGKTKALTHRIAYLINENIDPGNILAVTFTNKAAGEMKERVARLMNAGERRFPAISTFHSFCAGILRKEIRHLGYSGDFVIFDAGDQLSVIKKTAENLGINTERFKPKSFINAISTAKNELTDNETYKETKNGFFEEITAKVYEAYQNELKKNNAVDFDDLIMLTVEIFVKFPEILEKYRQKYKYILVDEYQDTNQAQYVLTKMLAEKSRNICVVGDDWQCIYSWRQADFRNILNFEKDWPDAKVIMLEENYRSTQNILDASHGIINKNVHRTQKKLWTRADKGEPIIISEVYNEESEGNFIVNEIVRLAAEKKLSLKDFVVLYRTNAQSRAIEEAFLRANIPYKIIGTVKFYSRKEIQDVIAYLRLIVNPRDTISLRRIIGAQPKGIGKKSLEKIIALEKFNITDKDYLSDNLSLLPRAMKSLLDFSDSIRRLRESLEKTKISNFIKQVLSLSGYENHIKDGTPEGEARWENTQELITVAKKYEHMKTEAALSKLIEDIALMSDADEVESTKDLVNLMTMHSVKGLEFPVVFMAGCEEGLMPHSRSLTNPTQMEEERRLCYVGITRAKQSVYMLFAARRNLYGRTEANPPSRFISDIPEHLVEIRPQIPKTNYLGDFDDNDGDDYDIIDFRF